MTLLERWDRGWMEGPSAKEEIRRALAIAQAVEAMPQLWQDAINTFADQLLRVKP